jgi:hypothetical protein
MAPAASAETTTSTLGVAFVSQEPFALDGAGTSVQVEVFNGSPRGQTLTLSVGGKAKPYASVAPTSKPAEAGEVITFAVKLDKAPSEQMAGELRAFSSDGTMARGPLTAGKGRPAAEAEAAAGFPKSLEFGGSDTGQSRSMAVTNLPGDAAAEVQVGHLSGAGEAVPVTRKGDTITVAGMDEPGEYSGTVDLTPGLDGGDVSMSADAHKDVWWAIAPLVIGLLVAAVSEFLLRRLRPEWVLERRLRDVKRLVTKHQQRAQADLERPDRPNAGGPRIYEPEDPKSLLEARAVQITNSLKNGASEKQRERWGPDGAEMEELEAEVESYEKVIATLVGVQLDWEALLASAKPGDRDLLESSPLRQLLDRQLASRVIGPGGLDRVKTVVEGLRGSLDVIASLYGRLVQLERDAPAAEKEAVAAKRLELIKSVSDPDDAKAMAEAVRKLATKVYGPPEEAEPDAEVRALAARVGSSDWTQPRGPSAHLTPPDDLPAMRLVPVPRDETRGSWWRRNFNARDVPFLVVSLAIALLSGLSVLYYGDDTFGSTGDVIAALIWGSTATAGVALVRRLIPGATKELSGT